MFSETKIACIRGADQSPRHMPGTDGHRIDFELQRLDDGKWRLRVRSQEGLYWVKSMNVGFDEREIYFNLIAANDFLRNVRLHGLRTEYIGPLGSSLL